MRGALLLATLLAGPCAAALLRAPIVPAPALWGGTLGRALRAASRGPLCVRLGALDPAQPGQGAVLEPLTRAMYARGYAPGVFAALTPERQAEAVRAALPDAVYAVRAHARSLAREARAEPRPAAAAKLARLLALHEPYLGRAARKEAEMALAEARARQGPIGSQALDRARAEAAGLLAGLAPDAEVLRADFTRQGRPPAARLRPSASGDATPEGARTNPGLYAALLAHGIPADEIGTLPPPRPDPLLGPFEAALALAQARAGPGRQAFFAEAWAPTGKRQSLPLRFVFYALRSKDERAGRRLEVAFEGGKPALTVTEDAPVEEGLTPFPLTPYLLMRGSFWGPERARQSVGERLPDADVGLRVSLRMRQVDWEDDLWWVFSGPGGELVALNGRTGSARVPGTPAPAPLTGLWLRLKAALRAWARGW